LFYKPIYIYIYISLFNLHILFGVIKFLLISFVIFRTKIYIMQLIPTKIKKKMVFIMIINILQRIEWLIIKLYSIITKVILIVHSIYCFSLLIIYYVYIYSLIKIDTY